MNKISEALKTENFVRWLGTQPPDKTYSYCDPSVCAAAQYFQSLGIKSISYERSNVTTDCLSPFMLKWLGWDDFLIKEPNTFGQAYNRGLKLLESHNPNQRS